MNKSLRRLLLAVAVIVPLLIAGSALAQTADWCVPPDGVTPVGCAQVSISPAGLLGDFYEGETLLATQMNPAQLLLTPGASHRIDVRNITSTEVGYGTLFVYNDGYTTVYPSAGAVSSATVYTYKKFVRGTANFTCDVKNVTETDIVLCRLTLDGVVQPDVLPAGTASFILDPGAHTFLVELVGDTATLWSPASVTQTVTIYAGSTSTVKPLFNKKGHLTVTLSVADVVADFYVDGTQVATQVATFDMWVAPFKSHKVEAKNVTDPLALGVYKWRDKVSFTSVQPGAEKALKMTLTKQFLQGFITITCDLPSAQPTDIVACNPMVDTVPLAQLLPGQSVTLPYNPGSHAAQIDLVGDQAFLWAPAVRTQTVYVYAGYTATFKPLFTKSAHLVVTLSEPGIAADIYVDNVLVAPQAASYDAWVVPGGHTIAVKNIFDPQAGISRRWKEASVYQYLTAGQEAFVVVNMVLDPALGKLTINCVIDGLQPGQFAYCQPYIIDAAGNIYALVGIAPGTSTTYTLIPGSYTLLVVVGPVDVWTSDPYIQSINVTPYGQINFRAGWTINSGERVRIGAQCVDGSTSTATGGGACSGHGGVSCWKYSDGTCTNP